MPPRKRILYIITKSIWGGATKYTADLASALPRGRFEVFVVAGPVPAELSKSKNLFSELANTEAKCITIKHFQKSINPLKDLFAFLEILRLLRKINPDIIHASSSKAGGLASFAAFLLKTLRPKKYKIKTIFTAHGWAFHEDRPCWQKELIKTASRLTVFFCDKVITVSEYDRASAIKNQIDRPDKFVTIRNGIDAKTIKFLYREEALEKMVGNRMTISDDLDIIGSVGEFVKNKGYAVLIDAARLIAAKYPKTRFIIVGHHGEEKSSLQTQILQAGLNKQVLLVDDIEGANKLMKAFDIFILPSLKEGLPYTLLEAGAAGLPVIATDVGGVPEIIEHQKSGLLAEAKNPKALAEAIETLKQKPELRQALAQNLHQKIISEFSFEKMLRETIALYD